MDDIKPRQTAPSREVSTPERAVASPATMAHSEDKRNRLQRAIAGFMGGNADVTKAPDEDAAPDEPEVSLLEWRAHEFAYTQKPTGWYILLGAVVLVLIGAAIWTKQWLSIGLFLVMGIALYIYAGREPRELEYEITNYGVRVGDKPYHFGHFVSYYEVDDYGHKTLDLVPAKRFDTLVSLPVPQELEQDIEGLIGEVLPKVAPRNDAIDRVFRFLRF